MLRLPKHDTLIQASFPPIRPVPTSRFLPVLLFLLAASAGSGLAQGPKPVKKQPPVSTGKDGKLEYAPDSLGNRIPDFSYCGYRAGAQVIPLVPSKVTVPTQTGDATARIQAALDYVATLPLGKDGFRGAVLLGKGRHEIAGRLLIRASGVVLRGSGMGPDGTTLLGTGYSRENLLTLAGRNNRKLETAQPITDRYVPVNARTVRVANAAGFKTGDRVRVQRPSTAAWIQTLGTQSFGGGESALGWKPGQRDLFWDRQVVAVDANGITLDAPLTTALDQTYGGGTVARTSWPGLISQVGVENLRLESAVDAANAKDEDHRWMAIVLDNVQDAWVRQVVFRHFAGSAVLAQETTRRITVEDCISTEPVSEIGGERRNTFMTKGQQGLFQRLYAEAGYHDFAVGYCAAGPNAFVQCEAEDAFSFSGAIDSWAAGTLFDIVKEYGQALRFGNREQDGQGAGWAAANSVFWQCTAARVDCYQPPTAQNWAFGTWAQFAGNGHWDQSNEHIKPRSLYYAQLQDRLGAGVASRAVLLPISTEASSSPPVAVAQELTRLSAQAAPTLRAFIEAAPSRQSIATQPTAPSIDQLKVKPAARPAAAAPLQVTSGKLVRGLALVTGRRQEVPWWNGSARPYGLRNPKPHVTRFVPGMTGPGLTDDLAEMTDSMRAENVVALSHNYGLWYERRRDDHERVKRMDGEVWGPFYEQPFARSGQGTAWDGLSRYDLTKYNKWYWGRLAEFADLADQKGLVLLNQHYFQHNIIEAGAHYADFPWRPVNNINHTGFPEPVPYAGDKRVFMAEQFYDVTDATRRPLHRAYIRQCLSNFVGKTGVVHLIGAEFTGPLSFVQFWLDTVKEWETETGQQATIALSTTKDVQDAILADPARAAVVDVIDINYWYYQADGSAYAPAGGQNLAPRQHARLLKPKRSSFEQVYRAVREYRQQFPGKAVLYSADSYDTFGWAVLLAGGSLPSLPHVADAQFAAAISAMTPLELPGQPAGQWALSNGSTGLLLYREGAAPAQLDLSALKGSFVVRRINPKTGQLSAGKETVKAGQLVTLPARGPEAEVLWLQKK
ncbi:DUF6298 domain-containing protein [Hymenobacter cellulosivorans]|uniref:DUF6298 domain-containing protein n=1 Tax=Hymenobacter cellulosivorans TaxID=2932249 RepID=A0ABY4F4W7_9BACT|nr:DUF6298 domain-containing protein [Hymenobacter cellulosivorans]UOQ51092.1 DUF6298 domain-containing protein [Hymenobacter cellulosivorans]